MANTFWYFKLFNSIKEEHEVDFAELELSSMFGKVEKVRNFSDILYETPLKHFTGTVRIQDMLSHELPYGDCHGFKASTDALMNVSKLVRRLGYIREIFIVTLEKGDFLQRVFPEGVLNKNVQIFDGNEYTLLRFITHQYFLEKSLYISKLSRNEEEVDRNIDLLFSFLTSNLYRIPATATMKVGKRLEDYFTIREEPSLHLTHYMHPYKARFHPKMVRALLNYTHPQDKGLVMDNFAGCGTLLVEATWVGLDSVGIEINPLSTLMSNVKCHSLSLKPSDLKKAIHSFLGELKSTFPSLMRQLEGDTLLFPTKLDIRTLEEERTQIPKKLAQSFEEPGALEKILASKKCLDMMKNEGRLDSESYEFLLLGLSGTISDLTRRKHGDLIDILQQRLNDLYLRVYIFSKLNETLKIQLGHSRTFAIDTREMAERRVGQIDAIVNSPPYSTAIDYIKNDYPQLVLLGLADIESLEYNMIGNPKHKVYPSSLFQEIDERSNEYERLPDLAKEHIVTLRERGRDKQSLRTYKFFKDMYLSLDQMLKVMKNGSKCAIVIGNNNYRLGTTPYEVQNDEILKQISERLGFKEVRTIKRKLEKTRTGMIRTESIIILEKP